MRDQLLLALGVCAVSLGCSTEAGVEGVETPSGSVNVSQGGAQDISEFRRIVGEGKVPAPETLDPVGFFAEHALDMPDADCGKDVCVHPLLAVAPRFNGGNWTMAFVSMNTAVDPSKLPRPPVHLAMVLERSFFASLDSGVLQQGTSALLAGLRPEDRVSVITFDAKAQTLALALPPDDPQLAEEVSIAGYPDGAGDKIALYDGIAAAQSAFEQADTAGFKGEHRVLLLTSGHATHGITDPEHILALGEGIVQEGAAFGVIGVGEEYQSKIPLALGSMGAGTYAYALDQQDLGDLLGEEGKTTLFPLATDFELKVTPAKGYKVGRIYGTKRATADASGATLSMPALFIGQRDGSSDVGGSRRGGGGGLFVELYADKDAASGIGENEPAFTVSATWSKAGDGSAQSIEGTLPNALAPGQNPPDMWWIISDGGSGKQYMMLNMYLALRGVLDFYQAGDCNRALGVVEMMKTSVGAWLGEFSDTDISDDNNLMLMLRDNIENACSGQSTPIDPTPPSNFDGGCCFI